MRLNNVYLSSNVVDLRDPSDLVYAMHVTESAALELELGFGLGLCVLVAAWVIEYAIKNDIV